LVGDYASIDASDGSGMNLMNIYTLDWDDRALNFADPNGRLRDKLGPIAASYSPAGYIAQYFVSRYVNSNIYDIILLLTHTMQL